MVSWQPKKKAKKKLSPEELRRKERTRRVWNKLGYDNPPGFAFGPAQTKKELRIQRRHFRKTGELKLITDAGTVPTVEELRTIGGEKAIESFHEGYEKHRIKRIEKKIEEQEHRPELKPWGVISPYKVKWLALKYGYFPVKTPKGREIWTKGDIKKYFGEPFWERFNKKHGAKPPSE